MEWWQGVIGGKGGIYRCAHSVSSHREGGVWTGPGSHMDRLELLGGDLVSGIRCTQQ